MWWLFWCLFPELRSNEGYKHQNNTRVSAYTVRHKSTYIILFLTRQNESKMTLKPMIFTPHPRVSLARFTLCWWRHNRLPMTSQRPDICDTNMWQVISNSLDIDFIHGDIHGRSCKKYKIMYKFACRTDYALTRWLFWCLFPELRCNEGNKPNPFWSPSHRQWRQYAICILLFMFMLRELLGCKL